MMIQLGLVLLTFGLCIVSLGAIMHSDTPPGKWRRQLHRIMGFGVTLLLGGGLFLVC